MYERLYGTAGTITFPLLAFSSSSFHNSLTSTVFASGDVKISLDYAGFTNTATTPTAISGLMAALSLTSAELSARHIDILVVDQTATKVWEDQAIVIETYGTTSAQHAFNRNQTAVQASLTAAQTGVTVATVTNVTNQVIASLTANQTGVTIATVTNVTNGVNLTTTAVLNNLAASATAQINAEVDTALADASVTAVAMNKIHDATAGATAVWGMTQSGFTTAGTFGDMADSTLSGIATDVTNIGNGNSTIKATLTAAQTGVTIATVTNVTNQVIASLTANQTGVTVATVTNITNGVNLTSTAVLNNFGSSATAQINAEMVDVVNVDTISELGQSAPPATPTMRQAMMAPYMALRNKITVTSTDKKFFNDAGTNVFTKALSDDGSTYTEAEAGAGS